MQKWEYAVLDVEHEPTKTPEVLLSAGDQGWEPVSMSLRAGAGGKNFLVVLAKRPAKATGPATW